MVTAASATKPPAAKKTAAAKKAPAPRKPAARRAPAAPDRSVAAAVDKLLATLTMDEAGEAKAAIARALARKLDQAAISDSGPVAMSMAGIAKELREVVDAILEGTADDEEFVAALFAPLGDTTHP